MQPARLMPGLVDRWDYLSIALALSAFFSAPTAFAEPASAETAPAIAIPEPTRTLTLPEALAYAHEHQPAIHAALSRVSATMAQAKIPGGQWLPTVSVGAQLYAMTSNNTTATYVPTDVMDVPRIGATPAVMSPSAASLSAYPSTFVGAGLLQEVFDFGRIGAQQSAADALVEVQKHQADVDRLDIDFGVEEAYFSVFAAKAIVRAADQAYERALVHRDFAK